MSEKRPENGKEAMQMYADKACTFPFDVMPRKDPAAELDWNNVQQEPTNILKLGKNLLGLAWIYCNEKVNKNTIKVVAEISKAMKDYAKTMVRRRNGREVRILRYVYMICVKRKRSTEQYSIKVLADEQIG